MSERLAAEIQDAAIGFVRARLEAIEALCEEAVRLQGPGLLDRIILIEDGKGTTVASRLPVGYLDLLARTHEARRQAGRSVTAWSQRLAAFVEEAAALLDPMICRTPGGGVHPGQHCAACCMNTGFEVGSQEELDLAVALDVVIAAAKRIIRG